MEVDLDANNNSTDKKGYSLRLRPRSTQKPAEIEDIPHEEVRKSRGRTPKPSKQKTLPLSKYRRKTANARERSRMREINEAFETLRKSIPLINTKCENPSEKNTKISTLRLAMKYITVLTSALRETDGDSDKDSIFSEYSLTPPDHRDSYTPTSTSDTSDFADTFFVSTLSHEPSSQCVSPFSSNSSFSLPDIPVRGNLPSWNSSANLPNYKATIVTCDNNDNLHTFQPVNRTMAPKSPNYQLTRLSALDDAQALVTPSSYNPPPPPQDSDLRFASLTPISLQLQSGPALDDWEDLSFSRVDFDELLST